MVRRLVIAAVAVFVLGTLALGGLAAYSTTLPEEDVLNDAAGRICRTIFVDRTDLPASPKIEFVNGVWSELSLEEALRLFDEFKGSAPAEYRSRVEQTKQAYSANKPFYETSSIVFYRLSGDPDSVPRNNFQCRFAVTRDLAGHAESRLELLYFDDRVVTRRDPAWQSLATSSGLSPSGYVQPTLWFRIMAAVSPVYSVWAKFG